MRFGRAAGGGGQCLGDGGGAEHAPLVLGLVWGVAARPVVRDMFYTLWGLGGLAVAAVECVKWMGPPPGTHSPLSCPSELIACSQFL